MFFMLSAGNTMFYDIETNAKKNSRRKFHFLKKLNPGTLTSWLQVVSKVIPSVVFAHNFFHTQRIDFSSPRKLVSFFSTSNLVNSITKY